MVTMANNWTPYEVAMHLTNNLAGDTLQILSYLPADPTYDEVTVLLFKRFPEPTPIR